MTNGHSMSALRQLAAIEAKEAELRDEIKELSASIVSMSKRTPAQDAPSPATSSPAIILRDRATIASDLDLKPEEAMMMGEISGMLQSAPTEALAQMLAQMRGTSVDKIMKAAAASVVTSEAPQLSDSSETQPAAAAPSSERANDVLPAVARVSHSKVMQSGRAKLLRSILQTYFRRHAPEGVHKVEELVARVVGGPPTAIETGAMVGGVLWTEAELFEKLESKYGERVDLDPHDHEL